MVVTGFNPSPNFWKELKISSPLLDETKGFAPLSDYCHVSKWEISPLKSPDGWQVPNGKVCLKEVPSITEILRHLQMCTFCLFLGFAGMNQKMSKTLHPGFRWFSHLSSSGRWQVVMEFQFPCSPRSQRLWKVTWDSHPKIWWIIFPQFFLQNGINVANFMGDPPCFNQPLGDMMGHLSKPGKCCTWCVPSKAKASTKPVSLSHLL